MVSKLVSKETCDAKYTDVKNDTSEIKEDIKFIKNNHLFHIERDLNVIKTWGTVLLIIPTALSVVLMIMELMK